MSATEAEQQDVNGPEDTDLKRVLGPKLLLLFIVGDILGAGVYAVTGKLAGQVGGIAWLPFLVAFAVATVTAFSYLELVTKYPQAAGAALYTHKAFGIHFITFLVAFTVVCSGITSASTSSNLLAANLLIGFGNDDPSSSATLITALVFMLVLAAINLRGVGESVKFNVLLTLVEMTALAIVIGIGIWVIARGDGDLSRITVFESPDDKGLFMAVTIATAIAFFSMVGFEDSVNMVEETQDPLKIFPRTMLTGLGIAVVIYMLVAISVVAVIPAGQIAEPTNAEAGILLDVVKIGAPDLPIDNDLPVPHGVRGRQHRPDQHADGEPAHLRHGPAGRAAALPRQGAPGPSLAVDRDRLHHPPGARPDHRGHPRLGVLGGRGAVGHHGPPAAGGVHHRQHRVPDPAPRPDPRGRLPCTVRRCRSSVPSAAATSSVRGRGSRPTWCSTRSRRGCSPSAWSSGR